MPSLSPVLIWCSSWCTSASCTPSWARHLRWPVFPAQLCTEGEDLSSQLSALPARYREARRSSSFCLVSKVSRCRLARRDRHLLTLGTIGLLPGRHGVVARRHVDGVGAVFVGHCRRTFDHCHVTMHPGVDVALD